jgi:hypothetical protein
VLQKKMRRTPAAVAEKFDFMLWKILIEICIASPLLFLAAGFWATAKSHAHLKRILGDPIELWRFCQSVGPDKLHREAVTIEPALGSYAANIETWNHSHMVALARTRNMMGLGAVVLLFTSSLLGLGYLVVSTVVFLFPVVFESPSAKNNNFAHIHAIMLNVIKWNEIDSPGCLEYCRNTSPCLELLYEAVQGGPRRSPKSPGEHLR